MGVRVCRAALSRYHRPLCDRLESGIDELDSECLGIESLVTSHGRSA